MVYQHVPKRCAQHKLVTRQRALTICPCTSHYLIMSFIHLYPTVSAGTNAKAAGILKELKIKHSDKLLETSVRDAANWYLDFQVREGDAMLASEAALGLCFNALASSSSRVVMFMCAVHNDQEYRLWRHCRQPSVFERRRPRACTGPPADGRYRQSAGCCSESSCFRHHGEL